MSALLSHTISNLSLLTRLLISLTTGIYLTKGNQKLVGYSDADFANDLETRKSISGYCALYGTSPLFWRSARQSIVTRSTAEAEFEAGGDLVRDIIPLQTLMLDVRIIN